jgi:hypothetical protein
MLNLYIKYHPWISTIATGTAIMFCQRIIEGSGGVRVNAFDDAAKFGVGIGVIDIGNRDGYAWIALDVLYFLRLVVCVNLICSPSHKNHIGDDCGSLLVPMVARWANAFECSIFWTFGLFKSAMRNNLSVNVFTGSIC